MNRTPLQDPVFRISYSLRGEDARGVRNKYFETAEDCRAWFVDHQREFSSYVIVELTHINLERLKMLAQLERECAMLGCE